MSRYLKVVGFAALLLLQSQRSVFSDVIVDLVPSNSTIILTGGTQTFSLDAQIAAGISVTQAMQGYTLPVDLSPPVGTDPPVGWTITSVTALNTLPGSLGFVSSTNPLEGDVLAGDGTNIITTTPITLTMTPLSLFRFTIELDNQAVAGVYDASFFRTGNLFEINDGAGTPLAANAIATNAATITLVVPEPSGLLPLCIFAGIAFNRRRRSS